MIDRTNVTWHEHAVERKRGCVVWLTGLSGSGKSTVANALDAKLYDLGIASFVLDGDNIRHGLNAGPERLEPIHGRDFANRFGLGFGAADRAENIRRIGCVAELFVSAGLIALTAFVSPFRIDRTRVRQTVAACGSPHDFVEVFVDTPLEVCEARDPKGLYQKARAGELQGFTGIDDPYEPPEHPEIHLDGTGNLEKLTDSVLAYLRSIGKIE